MGPQDYGWFLLERARERKAHPATRMRSGNSLGPIRMFVCDRCSAIQYVYHASDPVPVCCGGLRGLDDEW